MPTDTLPTPNISRENAQTKGRRYLLEGRLSVLRCDGKEIVATCRGQGRLYDCGYSYGRWFCNCPARVLCAHLVALQLVTVEPGT